MGETAGILKNENGIYDSDPKKNPNAKQYHTITYPEVLQKQLRVMDLTAITLAMERKSVRRSEAAQSAFAAVCIPSTRLTLLLTCRS